MKALPEAVQLELVKCIKEVFQSTLEVPFDTLERLSTAELVIRRLGSGIRLELTVCLRLQSDMCRTALEYLNQAVAERDSYARRLDSALAMHVMALPAAPSPKPAPAQRWI